MTTIKSNPTIGTCPCPVPKCSYVCEVRKFLNRSTRDTGHRFAGKLYLICPAHGRLGMDARQGMQDYILDNAKINAAAELPPDPAPAPVVPTTPAAIPAQTAAAAPAAKPGKPSSGFADWEW